MSLDLEPHESQSLELLLQSRTGLSFNTGNRQLLQSAAGQLMSECRISSLPALVSQLSKDQRAFDRMLELVTVPESYFFRDPVHFDFIRDSVFPDIARKRGPDHQFRVWSAGCAGGEEAYSLAFMFAQMGLDPRNVRILATDISRRALGRAKRGRYSAWSIRGERAQTLIPEYLSSRGREFQVHKNYIERVTFLYYNLAGNREQVSASETRQQDLILCRNVLIYFDPDTIARVAAMFYENLAIGGYLITGPSDPLLSGAAPFEVQLTSGGLVYRKRQAREPDCTVGPSTVYLSDASPSARRQSAARRKAPARKSPQPVREPQPNKPHRTSETSPDAGAMATPQLEALYNQALLSIEARQYDRALNLLRKVLYLDESLAMGHFTCGIVFMQLNRLDDASRSWKNALRLVAGCRPDTPVPMCPNETAGSLQASCQRLLSTSIEKRD